MSQIKYADLHCDSVTVSCSGGGNFNLFEGQVSIEKLKKSGCAAQCFALFTEGENAAADFEKFAEYYFTQISVNPEILPVEKFADIKTAENDGKTAAVLTVENLGFLNGDISGVKKLAETGVKMASLVWNNANALGYPNRIVKGGLPEISAREKLGLTALGKDAVEALNDYAIIVDVSHLSDGGVDDVVGISAAPVVASHSNCAAVCNVSRNLTDRQIKKIADKGGVVGLNFCRAFVVPGAIGDDISTGIQKGVSVFESILNHYNHLVKIGGEGVAALGSDFDGISAYDELRDCTKIPELLNFLNLRGVNGGALEKFARLNFYRVFKEVVG